MVHLSNIQLRTILHHITASGSTYLLATTYPTETTNRDSHDGHWRPVNLCVPPFSPPPPTEFFDTDYRDNGRNHPSNGLALWPIDHIPVQGI